MEVINRFTGVDLVGRVPEKVWMEVVKEAVTKTVPQKKKHKKAKWLSEKALKIPKERSERQERKGKIHPTECRVPENNKER